MKLLDLYAKMKGDLNGIERKLEEAVAEDTSLLGETSLHLLQAGGKRIRPVFVLLAGQVWRIPAGGASASSRDAGADSQRQPRS